MNLQLGIMGGAPKSGDIVNCVRQDAQWACHLWKRCQGGKIKKE